MGKVAREVVEKAGINIEQLLKKLNAAGIGAGIHYPIPIHLQPAYRHLGYRPGDFPVTERAAERILSLPMYAELTSDAIGRVVRAIEAFSAEEAAPARAALKVA